MGHGAVLVVLAVSAVTLSAVALLRHELQAPVTMQPGYTTLRHARP